MEILAADIVTRFYTFLWPMLRISAMMLTAPVFSQDAFNLRLRVLLALALTWMVYPLHTWPVNRLQAEEPTQQSPPHAVAQVVVESPLTAPLSQSTKPVCNTLLLPLARGSVVVIVPRLPSSSA